MIAALGILLGILLGCVGVLLVRRALRRPAPRVRLVLVREPERVRERAP